MIDILNAHVSGTSLRTRSMTSAARAALSTQDTGVTAVLGGHIQTGYLPTPYELYTMGSAVPLMNGYLRTVVADLVCCVHAPVQVDCAAG